MIRESWHRACGHVSFYNSGRGEIPVILVLSSAGLTSCFPFNMAVRAEEGDWLNQILWHPVWIFLCQWGLVPGCIPKTLQLEAAGAAHHVWSKWDRVLLAWCAGSRGRLLQLSLIREVGMAHCHWRYFNKNHLQLHSPLGHHRGGPCDRTPTLGALASLETHPPCCHCQTFWIVSTFLISVTSQDPATGSPITTPHMWAKWDGLLHAWSIGGTGKPSQLSLALEKVIVCSQ